MEPITTRGTHVREHTSVLADAEKRLLIRIARRMPAAVNSDHLTALGAAAMVAAGAAFAAASVDRRALYLVPVLLAVNWFGDSLDGTVARVRGHQRPRYGYYLDHVVDLATTTALFAGLALSGLMQPMLATLVLLGYVLLCAESFLATHTVGVFRLAFSGMGPTELRILLAVGALVATTRHTVSVAGLRELPLFDIGGWVAVVGMGVVFVLSACRNARALYLAEPHSRERPMTPARRAACCRSSPIGAAGFAVQLASLHLLVSYAGVHYLVATALAVEAAILHNFVWHSRWTWRDRPPQPGVDARTRLGRLARFNGLSALSSVAGNVAFTAVLVNTLGVPIVAANAIAVALVSALNFAGLDRWVFAAGPARRSTARAHGRRAGRAVAVRALRCVGRRADGGDAPRLAAPRGRHRGAHRTGTAHAGPLPVARLRRRRPIAGGRVPRCATAP